MNVVEESQIATYLIQDKKYTNELQNYWLCFLYDLYS